MMTNHSLSHKPASQLAIERERANRVTGRGAATVFAVSSTQPFAAWRLCVKEQCARTPVRAFNTALFHQGLLWNQKFSDQWSQQLGADVQVFREPNQIQLVCTTAGVVFIVQPGLGLVLSGPMTGAGNATTTSGGAIYAAEGFHVARRTYRLNHSGFRVGGTSRVFILRI